MAIYCPACGESLQSRIGGLVCPNVGHAFSKKISEWILRAVGRVEPVATLEEFRKPEKDSYFCPNCRGRLTQYDHNYRYYRCDRCRLELKAMSHFEIKEFEDGHESADEWYGDEGGVGSEE